MMLQWAGPVFALTTVATIAVGHHLVRKLNYHFGTRPAIPLFVLGAGIFAGSFFSDTDMVSGVLGIVGLTTIVDGVEILKQEKRIAKGHAPMNPNRPVSRISPVK
ncbi:MAG: DUF4491 family protein [Deltaproteobacteria bacterium]|nr:DUF4491 family protein [Deltaproteobacteria bacterium]